MIGRVLLSETGMLRQRATEATKKRAEEEFSVDWDCTPNQYTLSDGDIVDAEVMLYASVLEKGEE